MKALPPKLVKMYTKNIVKYGRQIVGVTNKDQSAIAYAYTIGNFTHKLPEFLLIGCPIAEIIDPVLNGLSEKALMNKKPFENGAVVDVGLAYPAILFDADPIVKEQYTIQVSRYYQKDNFTVQQVVLSDPKGVYPPDPGCDPAFMVPVFRMFDPTVAFENLEPPTSKQEWN